MKYTLLLFCALFCSTFLIAQDTTVVQTIKWADNFRTDTFHFPDDPAQSWRKIYLVYNMRCRNGTTCAEWDYSCNTFLTDPSRIDSTRQTFPEYVISGFSGNSFEYAIDPTYTYYSFLQHLTYLSGAPLVEGTVGLDMANLELTDDSGIRKTQLLFTAAELTAAGLTAGNLHGLKLLLNQTGAPLAFFNIRLKNTSKTELLANDPDLSGFTDVYFKNTSFTATGLMTFPFYEPFYWDGVSNLLVEWSATTPVASTATVLATDAGFPAALSTGQPDKALNFGSGSYVNIPNAPMADIASEITISLWSFGDANIFPVNSTIFEGMNAAGARAINVHLPWSNGSVYWDCGGNGGNYDRIEKAADPSEFEGQWNHWTFTKNTTTGSMKIYLNGVLWHSGTGKTIPIDFKSLILGGAFDHSLTYYGKIDEFQVWDKELDAATIAAWMRKTITPDHPDYAHLRAYYKFQEGQGNQALDSSPSAATAAIHLPNWFSVRGNDLYKEFNAATIRPNITFLQGDVAYGNADLIVLDSVPNAQQQVLHYGVAGTDLIVLDTAFYYPAGPMSVIDAATNEVVGQIDAPVDGTIQIQPLTYYLKRAARFELLSLVTPYGNGLSLGAAGKTFTFDVTDFAPVLQGNKVLSIEFGGEWQEDLDLKFVFVEGVPAKPVLDIQNIWPEGRGWYQDILDDRLFEPREVPLNPTAQSFKLRSAITGHGQNGEFVPQQHFLNVNGGNQEFLYDVWKYCGKNPIYPQGGTWIFDRAGWCPGMASDVHEFALNAAPGTTITLDYGLNGQVLSDANYLVSNQLVSYGAYTHALDASLEAIMRPNNRQVEYARINPACSAPLIRVSNSGATPITALSFEYEVQGGGSESYTWTGVLEPGSQTDIMLPVLSPDFWITNQTTKVFQVKIVQVNNQTDEETANNLATMTFTTAQNITTPNPLFIKTLTNNNGSDYSYTIKDANGTVVMRRDTMLSNTTYVDEITLPNGCYTLNFEDVGNDGLSFWFFPEYGSGAVSISRQLTTGSLVPVKSFNSDFGGGVQYDFVIARPVVGVETVDNAQLIGVYPNPATDKVVVELKGFDATQLSISVRDVHGREMVNTTAPNNGADSFSSELELGAFPAGLYFIRITDGKSVWVREVVKQ